MMRQSLSLVLLLASLLQALPTRYNSGVLPQKRDNGHVLLRRSGPPNHDNRARAQQGQPEREQSPISRTQNRPLIDIDLTRSPSPPPVIGRQSSPRLAITGRVPAQQTTDKPSSPHHPTRSSSSPAQGPRQSQDRTGSPPPPAEEPTRHPSNQFFQHLSSQQLQQLGQMHITISSRYGVQMHPPAEQQSLQKLQGVHLQATSPNSPRQPQTLSHRAASPSQPPADISSPQPPMQESPANQAERRRRSPTRYSQDPAIKRGYQQKWREKKKQKVDDLEKQVKDLQAAAQQYEERRQKWKNGVLKQQAGLHAQKALLVQQRQEIANLRQTNAYYRSQLSDRTSPDLEQGRRQHALTWTLDGTIRSVPDNLGLSRPQNQQDRSPQGSGQGQQSESPRVPNQSARKSPSPASSPPSSPRPTSPRPASTPRTLSTSPPRAPAKFESFWGSIRRAAKVAEQARLLAEKRQAAHQQQVNSLASSSSSDLGEAPTIR